jgi:hypothetical protein
MWNSIVNGGIGTMNQVIKCGLTVASLFTAALMVFAFAACTEGEKGSDGYTFGTPTFVHNELDVTIVSLPSRQEVIKQYVEITNPKTTTERAKATEIKAFSVLSSDGCTIYIVDPAVSYKPEAMGHELAHCIYGEWHR